MDNKERDIYRYECFFHGQGYGHICGVDEAGRGPLAGPVVAAAVILPAEVVAGIGDSKKLSEKKRLALLPVIMEKALVGIGIATHEEIDEINILQATFLAMRRAVDDLCQRPDMALVDGNADPHLGIPTRAIVGGDAQSASIGAASIVAKCTRDRMMCEAGELYREYNFAKHKGYPTKEHYAAIAEHGLCPVHRRSFIKARDLPPGASARGSRGEDYAAQKLKEMDFTLLVRNYRTKLGEIDIVAMRDDVIAFIEVKTRIEDYRVSPGEAVSIAKQRKLIKAAERYLLDNNCDLRPRFDVFEILTYDTTDFNVLSYNLIEGAFDVNETNRYD